MKLSDSLLKNINTIKAIFADSSDFYTKSLAYDEINCCIVLMTGISSPEKLCVMALQAMQLIKSNAVIHSGQQLADYLMNFSCIPTEPNMVQTVEQATELLSNGMALLLIDGSAGVIAFSTQDMPQRGISVPGSEGNVRGSQEGFTELLRNNIALLRHQFRNGKLVCKIYTSNSIAKTEYCICYDKTCASQETVNTIEEKLKQIMLPILLDSSYFASFFKQDKLNLFQSGAYTERPATAAARICEGKVVILVAGCPNAMIVPAFFSENFECLDDYASGAVFAGLIRLLKYCAFAVAIFAPGFYVMAVSFTPEIIPIQLLSILAKAEQETPLPPVLEMMAVCLVLEIIREAGLRAPKAISQSVSLVGALIIGDTAVQAGIVSVPILTVAAISTIATLAVPSLYEQTTLFRFAMLILCGVFGMPGIAMGTALIIFMACGSEMLGYNYLYPLFPLQKASFFDGYVRTIWSQLATGGEQLKDDTTN